MKILVVDDHEYNRELLSFILLDEGYQCVEAVNGLDACEKCRSDSEIDLILMDVTMPEMDGITATSIIKKENSEKFIPIIFVTALDDVDVLTRCLEAGGDDFVPKPISESVLLAKIKAHSRSRELYVNLQKANKQLEYHKQVMDREHQIVERIYEKGSLRIKTDCENVKKYTSPVSMFNGDIILEAPSPSGGVYNLVGDFTGHGLAASIGSLPVTEVFCRLAAQQANVGLLAKEINKSLVDLLPSNMFFCAAITYLDSQGKGLSLWAGGMNDLIHVSPSLENKMTLVASEHMPLGILQEEEFDETPMLLELKDADRIYIYTDGIIEAENESGEQFGPERLADVIGAQKDETLTHIIDAVREFQHGQNDDISMIEIVARTLQHRSKSDSEIVDVKELSYAADSFPWKFVMRIEDEELKSTSIVDQVMSFIGGIQGIELHREKIFTIISELYSNALEHGVLGLESEMKNTADGFETYYIERAERLNKVDNDFIELEISFIKDEKSAVEIKITDSGKGFDYNNMIVCVEKDDDAMTHGRGIALLLSLCSNIEYSNSGRTVCAKYDLCFH